MCMSIVNAKLLHLQMTRCIIDLATAQDVGDNIGQRGTESRDPAFAAAEADEVAAPPAAAAEAAAAAACEAAARATFFS